MTEQVIDLEIGGMTCRECAQTLERALGAVPGVRSAVVSYGTKRGRVILDEAANAATVEPRLIDVVKDNGYHATATSDSGAASSAPARHDTRPARQAPSSPRHPAKRDELDLVIIGTGAAGMAAAIRASELGATSAIVERGEVGGTCVNIGCIPSKYLIEAAHHYHTARSGAAGITACEPGLAWEEVVREKRDTVSALRQEKYVDVLKAYDGVTLHRGRAELLGGGRVRVGDRELRAGRIVVSTGTRPSAPPIAGLDAVGALDSTSAMELERLPGSMIVLGAGSIGLELGQAFSRFGVRVIVVEALDRILPNESPEVSALLEQVLIAEGMEIHTGMRALRAERTAAGVVLHVQEGSVSGTLIAETLLIATGRRPNTEGLGLEREGVRLDARGFIVVDEYMRSSSAQVFAAGDVTGGPGYVYVAALQGGIAAQAALADRAPEGAIAIDLGVVPRVTFTDPQVAAVGLTEGEARAAGLSPRVTTLPLRHLPRAIVSHRTEGAVMLVAEEGTERLLGAHIVSTNAGDVIGEIALAIRYGLTSRDLVSTLHAYLTWGEGLKLAAQTFTKDVAQLSCCA